jgi:putative ABC transport system permease protein
MSRSAVLTLTRTSLRARLGRMIAISVAILLGVSFVSGTFVLADSLRKTFGDLFTDLNANVDLEVRSALAFGDPATSQRDPVAAALVDELRSIDGVTYVEPVIQRYAQLLDKDGDPILTQGAPYIGAAWSGDTSLTDIRLRGDDSRAPSGPGETALDLTTAKKGDFQIGDEVTIITDAGRFDFTIVGFVGIGDEEGFGGATVALFDPQTAQQVMGTGGGYDAIDLALADDADPAAVTAAIQGILPPRTEVVTGQEVADEAAAAINDNISIFANGLLAFAFITAFVAAFIINNVFQITIYQRLRELALLRAVGASGRQVRRMITLEALIVSVIATVVGIAAGLLVARGIVAIFNAAGAGFPDTQTVLLPRTIIVAVVVGVGITLASVLIPARRAARVPPVAAMRPEIGFASLSAKRLLLGVIASSLGAVMFLVGLFTRPGGTLGLIFFAGVGALVLFVGVASLSSTVARPVVGLLGAPAAKLLKTPGVLARDNAARQPRRTSSMASAFMIGVALVSAAAVFASSLRATFVDILENSVKSDYVVTDEAFQGLPTSIADELATLSELDAVSPVRGIGAKVAGDEKSFGAVAASMADMVDIDMLSGGFDGLDDGGLLVHKDPAGDLGLKVGDSVDVTYQNGVEGTLKVVGIYGDASLVGNWLISLDTLEAVTDQPARDFFIVAKLADDVDPVVADKAVRDALAEFPQANVQTNAEFRKSQEGQISQLLVVITVLLVFSIIIAVLGVSITLALSVFERTREIGLLRAVGMTRRQTRRTVRWEAVIVTVFGALVGVVLGSLIGVALSLAVPDTLINGITFSPLTIVLVFVGAIIAGLIAAVYPMLKASNMDVLRAIVTE